MEAKHTPGPWEVDSLLQVVARINGGNAALCKVFPRPLRLAGQDTADARLMAAAPALLSALQTIMSNTAEYAAGGIYIISVNGRDLLTADAAIAAATGAA